MADSYGYVYMVYDPEQPQRVKVGKTNNLKKRLLNLNTSILEEFKLIQLWVVTDKNKAEKICHSYLTALRIRKNREIFAVSNLPMEIEYWDEDRNTTYVETFVPAGEIRDELSQELDRAGLLVGTHFN